MGKELTLTGTHKPGPFNSTDFTDCCGLAVLRGDTCCPGCGRPFLTIGAPFIQGKCRMCGKLLKECHC